MLTNTAFKTLLKKLTSFGLFLGLLLATLLIDFALQTPKTAKAASIEISNCTQLQDMELDLTADYVVTQSFSCSGIANFSPIGPSRMDFFTGTFDGGNYEISDLTINRPDTDFIGLFGVTGAGSEIANVKLVDVNITGDHETAGLVGESNGPITNSSVTGSVTGESSVGGLAGYSEGAITSSSASGSVTGFEAYSYSIGGLVGYDYGGAITNSYATGSVTGTDYVGGLVGYDDGGAITNSYAIGSITGDADTGGLVGVSDGSTVTNSYWDKETTGQTTSDGSDDSYGKTIAEMKTQSTYEPGEPNNWDFDTIWAIICSINNGYPYLQWQTLPTNPCDEPGDEPGQDDPDAPTTPTTNTNTSGTTVPNMTILPKTGR